MVNWKNYLFLAGLLLGACWEDSQHFSKQDMSYNTYINELRVNHFIALYREAVAAQRSVTALQLAQESGFSNYRTFSNAFKRKTGQSVSSWIQGQERPKVE